MKIFDPNMVLTLWQEGLDDAFTKRAIFWILTNHFIIDPEPKPIIGIDDEGDVLILKRLDVAIEVDDEVLPIPKIAVDGMAQLVSFWKVEAIDPENLFFYRNHFTVYSAQRGLGLDDRSLDNVGGAVGGDGVSDPKPDPYGKEQKSPASIEPDGAASNQTRPFC